MRKLIVSVLAIVCVVTMIACNTQTKPQKKWDFTITYTEASPSSQRERFTVTTLKPSS